jgi:hypothetical protein
MIKESVKGVWRNPVTCKDLGDRYRVGLKCGHVAILHKNVPLYNGLFFHPTDKNVFCTQCDPKDYNSDFPPTKLK